MKHLRESVAPAVNAHFLSSSLNSLMLYYRGGVGNTFLLLLRLGETDVFRRNLFNFWTKLCCSFQI